MVHASREEAESEGGREDERWGLQRQNTEGEWLEQKKLIKVRRREQARSLKPS